MTEQACAGCGARNAAGSEFCGQCGAFLAWDGAGGSAAATSVAPASLQRSATAAAPAAPGGRDGSAPAGPEADEPAGETLVPPAVGRVEADELVGPACPGCALVNAPGRRFCAHCGYGFPSSVPRQPAAPSAWSSLGPAEQDRMARRAYRRSLPTLYRWRRVLVSAVLVAVVVVVAVVVRHPVVAVRDAWYTLEGRYVRIDSVSVSVVPVEGTAPGSDPAALVDGSDREWTQTWAPTGTSGCGAAPGTAEIVLTFPATRVRQLQVWPGLAASNPARLLQPVPEQLGVTFPGQPCRPVALARDSTAPLELDSGVPVTSVRIGVTAVRANGAGDAPLTSITEVILRSLPH